MALFITFLFTDDLAYAGGRTPSSKYWEEQELDEVDPCGSTLAQAAKVPAHQQSGRITDRVNDAKFLIERGLPAFFLVKDERFKSHLPVYADGITDAAKMLKRLHEAYTGLVVWNSGAWDRRRGMKLLVLLPPFGIAGKARLLSS